MSGTHDITDLSGVDRSEFDRRWNSLEGWVKDRFSKTMSVEGLLFLIGLQNRGTGYTPKLGKEEKQDIIMEGTYCALECLGFYQRVPARGQEDGYEWSRTPKTIPKLDIEDQEYLLKVGILTYFKPVIDE